jgi:hypothetical protein
MSSLGSFKKKRKNKLVDPLNDFERRFEQEGRFGNAKVVRNYKNAEKMSEVLLEFIEPYKHLGNNEEQYRKLISMAVVGWNMALLPENERKNVINKFAKKMKLGFWEKRDFRGVINDFVERKLKYFPDNKRYIIDFEITDLGDRDHLSVISTLPQDEEKL